MAGYSQDAQTALSDLQNSDPHNLIKLVGGDGFAYIRDYPNPVYPVNLANDRLYYTSFSSPVSNCAASIHNTDFYGHYYGSFHVCAGNAAMLAHDAALTMFNAIEKLPYEGDIKAYRNTLWKALKQIDKYHPLSDPHMVTGIVTFDGGERADPLITFFHVTNGQISSFS